MSSQSWFVRWCAISKISVFLSILSGHFLVASPSQAKDIYIAHSAIGAANGADCADAVGLSYLNTASNWVPGNTYHLCGTITLPAGGFIAVLNSGTASSPITIMFEDGAILQAPYLGGNGSCAACQGGITVTGNYVTIDGGTNGIIQNTANGTALANQHNSVGVYLKGSNLTLRNLTIQNIYLNQGSGSSATDVAGINTADVRVDGGSSSIQIYNNILNNASIGISSDTAGSNVEYYNNTLVDHHWKLCINGSGSPNIFNNDISGWSNWLNPGSAYHTDGIIVYGDSSVITPFIYSNYFHGDLGNVGPTGMVFCTSGTPGNGSGSACTIFNNLFVGTGYSTNNDSAIFFQGSTSGNPLGPHVLYNNTFVNFGYQIYFAGDASTHIVAENNIFVGGPAGATFYISQGSNSSFSNLTMTNNVYFGGRAYGPWNFGSNGGVYTTLASWRAACGCDANSSTQNPALDSTYHLTANSPAANVGVNLANTGILPLDKGKPSIAGRNGSDDGAPRSSSATSWAAGAYPSTAGLPAPPTALTATVQ